MKYIVRGMGALGGAYCYCGTKSDTCTNCDSQCNTQSCSKLGNTCGGECTHCTHTSCGTSRG